jgi:alpha-tubulin suppressor-like RCC1 family protein
VEHFFLLFLITVIYLNNIYFSFKKKESLFLFGSNENNQLCFEGADKIFTITNDIFKTFKIDPKKIKKLSCGFSFSLILIEGGLK